MSVELFGAIVCTGMCFYHLKQFTTCIYSACFLLWLLLYKRNDCLGNYLFCIKIFFFTISTVIIVQLRDGK